jgi:hypothetical protein
MTGQPGRSGGARTGAGRPPGTGGTPGTGRPKGAHDVTLSPARLVSPGQKWKFAERAVEYADQMLEVLVDIALNGESEAARVAAAGKVIDRAMGKAPQHVDVTALRHTEIVYRSAEEIRQELLARGVPKVLLDYDKNSDKP